MKFLGIFFFTLSAVAWAGTPPAGTVNVPDLVERVDKGVVNIQSTTFVRQRLYYGPGLDEFFRFYGIPAERMQKQPSLGSGFVIDKEGYVLTNNHVIENASEIEVFFNDKKKTKIKAKVVGRDSKLDLALLKVAPGDYLQPLEFGDSDKARVGETVVAIGNPFGLSHTVTAGIISAKNRAIGQGPFDNFIQTDASINFGNSGGPLFNASGEVIGINTAINAAGTGLGFAIPISQALKVIPDFKEHGKVRRNWLGVTAYATPYGLLVDRIVVGGPADKAGVRAGDLIRTIAGDEISDRMDAAKALDDTKAGQVIKMEVDRPRGFNSRSFKLDVKLTEEPKTRDLPGEFL